MIMAAPFPRGWLQLEHSFFPLTDLLGGGGKGSGADGHAAGSFDEPRPTLLSAEPHLRSPAGRPVLVPSGPDCFLCGAEHLGDVGGRFWPLGTLWSSLSAWLLLWLTMLLPVFMLSSAVLMSLVLSFSFLFHSALSVLPLGCLSNNSCLRSQSASDRTIVFCGSEAEERPPRLGEGRAEERGVRGITVSSRILRSSSWYFLSSSATSLCAFSHSSFSFSCSRWYFSSPCCSFSAFSGGAKNSQRDWGLLQVCRDLTLISNSTAK